MFSRRTTALLRLGGLLAVCLFPIGLGGQVPGPKNDLYASQFRSALVKEGQLPSWTGAVLVSMPGFPRGEATPLADSMAAVAIDLLRDADEDTAAHSLNLASSIVRALQNTGAWPEERQQGVRLVGAGDLLLHIATAAPDGRRLVPLSALLRLPDQERWIAELAALVRSEDPIALDAVRVLWHVDSLDPERREEDKASRRAIVIDLHRRDAVSSEARRFIEFLERQGP